MAILEEVLLLLQYIPFTQLPQQTDIRALEKLNF